MPAQIRASLRGVKQASSVLTRDASDYLPGYSQHLLVQAPEAIYSPQWENGYSPFDTVSFAIYRFDLTARTGRLGINTDWSTPPGAFTKLWLGASNWSKNRWDWSSGAPSGDPQLAADAMGAYRHGETGEMYVAVVLLGQSSAKLRQVWLSCSKRGDWWMNRRDPRHSACSPFTGPDYPTVQWQISLTMEGSGAAYGIAYDYHGVIYTCARTSLDTATLYAINPDGTEQWRVAYNVGSFPAATPAVDDDGTVYFTPTTTGPLHALNPDGSMKWDYLPHEGAVGSPVIGPEGNIYIGAKSGATNAASYLCAVKRDGALRWEKYFNGAQITDPALSEQGTVYVGCTDNMLYSFQPDGAAGAEFNPGAPIANHLALDSIGNIYFASSWPKLHCLNPALEQLWELQLPNGVYWPEAIDANTTIFAGNDYNMCAIDAAGVLKWSYYRPVGRCAVDAQGTSYVLALDGRIYAIDNVGQLKWWFSGYSPFQSDPAIGEDGTLYALDGSGTLYALGPGAQLEEHAASGYVKDADGVGLAGVTVSISGEEPVLTDGTGYWHTDGLAPGAYLVAPTFPGWSFAPVLHSFTIAATDLSVEDFVGQPVSPPVWPMWGGDSAHTRRSPHAGPDTPVVRWSLWQEGDAFLAEPVIDAAGAVYFQGDTGFYCLDATTGMERWSAPEGTAMNCLTPAIGLDGTVYSAYQVFPILRAYTPGGVLKWTMSPFASINGPPVIAPNGTVVIGGSESAMCFSPDGVVQWVSAQGRSVVPAIGADGTIYLGNNGSYYPEYRHVVALNPDGSVHWLSELHQFVKGGPTQNSIIATDGVVYYTDEDSDLNSAVVAMNDDGSVKWVYAPAGARIYAGAALASDGTLHFRGVAVDDNYDCFLQALNSDGTPAWQCPTGGYKFSSEPTVDSAGVIYIGVAGLSEMWAINPDGTVKWTFDTPADCTATAIGADGTLYFGNEVGYLYALGPGGG